MPLDVLSLHHLYLRRVVCTAAGCCGFRTASALARWLADGLFDLAVPARRIASRHLAQAFGGKLSDDRRDRLIRAGFEHVGRFWVEAVFARRKLAGRTWRAHVARTGPIDLDGLARARRGAIFVTPYLGNPAAAAYVLGQSARPVHVVVDAAAEALLRQWQDGLCHPRRVAVLTGAQAVHRADGILDAGGKLLVVGEHFRCGRSGPQALFLGRHRVFYPTVALLAVRCSVPIVVCSCRRRGADFRFELRGDAFIDPRTAAEDDPVADLTRRYVRAMEQVILQCPEQYFWARRWDDDDQPAALGPTSMEVTER